MNLSWFLFYGRYLGMQKQEILNTRYSEMLDMVSCLAIFNGANPKQKNRVITDFDAAMQLR